MHRIAISLLFCAPFLRADWVLEQKNFITRQEYKVLIGKSAMKRIWWDAAHQRADWIIDFETDTATWVDYRTNTFASVSIRNYLNHTDADVFTENRIPGKPDKVAGVDCTWYSFSTNRVIPGDALDVVAEACFAPSITMYGPYADRFTDFLNADEKTRRGGAPGVPLLIRSLREMQYAKSYETTRAIETTIDPAEFRIPPGFVHRPISWKLP